MTFSARDLEPGLHTEIVSLARRYCHLIDSCSSAQGLWLRGVAELLPRLHAGISSLDVANLCFADQLDVVDLDARFELFSHLRGLLADRDSYWLEFDRVAEGVGAMTGSLADDLTDIYCELKQGLRLFELDPEYAIAALATGYEQHWGRHLVDAERHLAMLGAEARLTS
ncbi:DUF5063 domain-containing protein [Thiocystis violacea]|uniref:DUF5063 domain-containing protein n=1 Tax=Thiocystis violacea TaxID=13725 RepID=UPI001F5B15FD|nr:DUF5063 domain-containing protein [Thiocystis violacea]